MTNNDNSQLLPPEIEELYLKQIIKAEEVEPMLKLRHELIQAAPHPREGFQSQLAQRLAAEFEQETYSKPSKKSSRRLPVRLTIALAAVIIFGGGAVLAVNAILQQFIHNDAGLTAAFTSGSGIQINQSQTVGNYTVNLQWANADSNRLTVGFSVSGFACPVDYLHCDIKVTIFNANGEEIPMIDGRSDSDSSIRTYLYNFDLANLGANTESNTFQFQVTPYGMTNDGIDPNQPNVIKGHSVTLEQPIGLNFSVPISGKVRTLNAPQKAVDKNITVTLNRVMVTPSQTRIVVCFVPPAYERSWTTIPHLTTNGKEVEGGGAVNVVSGFGEAQGETCNEHIYNAAMFDYKGNWKLEVTELVGFGKTGSDQQRIAGSWAFHFQVPF